MNRVRKKREYITECIGYFIKRLRILCTNSSVQIENHLVTQTVELMNHTNRIKSMIETYNEEMV